ncbi:class I SAM-dependent RNA methyltransferase [Ruania alba]|uniref:tRNA/tmRNA/rRNA uracil-C5-methylase, TrmA/RlmC/RlmD family n=1 Tax=Ruania alba TaxID=648782 RepID=A0A1H5FKU3_9MICO|nr:TRAM domain-containing protein [Ruania alba]SEE03961.1 tRNA/tmRNA/rRNA uracil-C5-methylase, TrmA/RlmC/RlmD family [Ruania alba]
MSTVARNENGESDVVELTPVTPVHGGHCLARLDGRVVFVRHTLPGERVRARLTDASRRGHWRADAIEVLEPSADRVPSVWPEAGADGVGGGELAHVSLAGQRRWKKDVLVDALTRIGGLAPEAELLATLTVRAAAGDEDRNGLGYRTRIELVADQLGRAGMFRHRTHDVVPLETMPLAVPELEVGELLRREWRPGSRIDAVAPSIGPPMVLVDGVPLRSTRRAVREEVLVDDRRWTYRVAATGFWQVHDAAPSELVRSVLAAARPADGATVLDLYSGSGLLTVPLAEAVGESGVVHAIEGEARAVRDARRNVHDHRQVHLHEGPVNRVLGTTLAGTRPDVVVLDPPRAGAGEAVVEQVLSTRPERVVYVACDPAALARDVAYAREHGYTLDALDAVDLFPHTHHVETVALLTPA